MLILICAIDFVFEVLFIFVRIVHSFLYFLYLLFGWQFLLKFEFTFIVVSYFESLWLMILRQLILFGQHFRILMLFLRLTQAKFNEVHFYIWKWLNLFNLLPLFISPKILGFLSSLLLNKHQYLCFGCPHSIDLFEKQSFLLELYELANLKVNLKAWSSMTEEITVYFYDF